MHVLTEGVNLLVLMFFQSTICFSECFSFSSSTSSFLPNWISCLIVVFHSNTVSVAQLNCTFILEHCCYQGWLHHKGYSCNEGRLMGAGTNWHCALIGGFPKYIPVRQQTKSKIANCTGLGCFKSLALYSWSCCALLLQHISGNHQVGSERQLALSNTVVNPLPALL